MEGYEDFYDEENPHVNNRKEDKILNNSYNSGDIGYENFSQSIKIDNGIKDLYKDTISENLIEERILKLLDEMIYDIFLSSPYYEKYKNLKRIDKNDLIKMYYYFKDILSKENTFTSIQMFVGFAEFFQLNYNQLYAEISVMDKEELLKELDEKFCLNKKIKTKKLF